MKKNLSSKTIFIVALAFYGLKFLLKDIAVVGDSVGILAHIFLLIGIVTWIREKRNHSVKSK